jgi:hypothetical protein
MLEARLVAAVSPRPKDLHGAEDSAATAREKLHSRWHVIILAKNECGISEEKRKRREWRAEAARWFSQSGT